MLLRELGPVEEGNPRLESEMSLNRKFCQVTC